MLEWMDVEETGTPKRENAMKNKDWWLGFCTGMQILVFLVFISCLILALTSGSADAQTWDWSPPAAHHAAVCRVQSASGRGSGVYIKHDNLRGILTAAHITEGQNTEVIFSDGTKATGKSTIDKFGYDVSFVFVTHSTISPIPMATTDPRPGDKVEFLTVGGPERRLRTFWATIRATRDRITEYNCDVLSGDSGGGILNIQKKLVGIQVHGYGENILTAWNGGAYRGAGSASCKPIRDFLGRVAKCRPKGCPMPGGGVQFYPPKNPKLVPVRKPDRRPAARGSDPEDHTPGKPPGLSIDYSKLIKMILAEVNPDDFRGPVGPPGSPGADGAIGPAGPTGSRGAAEAVDINNLAERIKKRIQGSIRVKVRPVN